MIGGRSAEWEPGHRSAGWRQMTTEVPFSDQLEAWLSADGPKTIGDLGRVFSEKSFAVTILFLMFVPALPLPTGGVTHVFEVIVVLLAVEMIIGARSIWLPARWKDRALGATTTEKGNPVHDAADSLAGAILQASGGLLVPPTVVPEDPRRRLRGFGDRVCGRPPVLRSRHVPSCWAPCSSLLPSFSKMCSPWRLASA